jgi:hypothetical protein
MVIVSNIDGRLRLRDERLKNPEVIEGIRKDLGDLPGLVCDISANRRVGSLLVYYEPPGSSSDIIVAVENHLKKTEEGKGLEKTDPLPALLNAVKSLGTRKAIKFGMLGTLAISLVGVAFDIKKMHLISGLLFLSALGMHLSSKRRFLFT